jgi:hypothetical protein
VFSGIMVIADEVDSQLMETVRSLMSMKLDVKPQPKGYQQPVRK